MSLGVLRRGTNGYQQPFVLRGRKIENSKLATKDVIPETD